MLHLLFGIFFHTTVNGMAYLLTWPVALQISPGQGYGGSKSYVLVPVKSTLPDTWVSHRSSSYTITGGGKIDGTGPSGKLIWICAKPYPDRGTSWQSPGFKKVLQVGVADLSQATGCALALDTFIAKATVRAISRQATSFSAFFILVPYFASFRCFVERDDAIHQACLDVPTLLKVESFFTITGFFINYNQI